MKSPIDWNHGLEIFFKLMHILGVIDYIVKARFKYNFKYIMSVESDILSDAFISLHSEGSEVDCSMFFWKEIKQILSFLVLAVHVEPELS